MAKKKKEQLEFRYYEIPQGECVLPLYGLPWKRAYGRDESGEKIRGQHFHNLMEIGYCREGEGILCFEEEVLEYKPGLMTIFPENFPHNTYNREEELGYWEYLFLDPKKILRNTFPEDTVRQKELLTKINKSSHHFYDREHFRFKDLFEAILEEHRNQDCFYKTSVSNYCNMLMIEIARLVPETEDRIKDRKSLPRQISRILDYITIHYNENIRIEEVAAQVHLSETHFRRIFEEHMNMTPVEYINFVRVQNACEMMKKTDYSMDEVAIRVGYTAVSTFNRNFKKMIGMSPYQWKKDPTNYESKLLNARITAKKGW